MATVTNKMTATDRTFFQRYVPSLDWLPRYSRDDLPGDVIAGVIVAVMLVPQSMAYALLAGLPPQVGLYTSILPLLIYGLLGTSRTMAVGPVAIMSLMVGSSVSSAAPEDAISIALTLAFLVGILQLVMGVLRVGFLVNFLSHPVLAGFINAAALVIGISQIKHLTGISVPRYEYTHETVLYLVEHLSDTNFATLGVAVISIAVLLFFKRRLAPLLRSLGLGENLILPIQRSGPLFVVVLGILWVSLGDLETAANVAVVGDVPAGLPGVHFPGLGQWQTLLPTALTISLVGYMESISVAKSLASKRRQKVDANQELIALGVANLGASVTGGYPVAGGIGRSVVNFSAGANTGLASMITAFLMAVTVLVLTPLFYNLPQAVLASIIVVAVMGLIDTAPLIHAWKYNHADAVSMMVTFAAVLLVGVEQGVLYGVLAAVVLYLWRTSRPHIAVVGRVGDSEHFRNVLRHEVTTHPEILAIRVDESLYFPNAQYLEGYVLNAIAENPQVDHLVLICSAVNFIDVSALEVLEALHIELRDANVGLYLAEVKGPVMDNLRKIGFVETLGEDHIFLSTHLAITTLQSKTTA